MTERQTRETFIASASGASASGAAVNESLCGDGAPMSTNGPLDLLLDLIRKQNIDIYEFPSPHHRAFLAYTSA